MIKQDQPTLFDSQKLVTATSSRQDGNLDFRWSGPKVVLGARAAFCSAAGISMADSVCMNVRSPSAWDDMYEATQDDKGAGMSNEASAIVSDAMITNCKGIALVLLTADCNPVIMYDPAKEVVALVHLGWQSSAADLVLKVVARLKQQYGSKASSLLVYNGPSIRAQSYVFEPPITQMALPQWAPYLVKVDGKIGIDLVGYNRQQFITAGVPESQIEICPVDTAASADYFSHYRAMRNGETEGRFATICMLCS